MRIADAVQARACAIDDWGDSRWIVGQEERSLYRNRCAGRFF
jgi:hypothetical protein